MLKHCAENRKRRLSALPNVGPYIYDVKISGFTRSSIYTVYDISMLRVNVTQQDTQKKAPWWWRTYVETCRSCRMLINYRNSVIVVLLYTYPPSISESKNELYICSTYGPSWPVLGWTLHLPLPLRMSGTIILAPVYAFISCVRKLYIFHLLDAVI
jgi:hypothetical protein